MKTTTAKVIEQQSLKHYYSTSSLIETRLEVLNYMELELESILLNEFEQGLPTDLNCGM